MHYRFASSWLLSLPIPKVNSILQFLISNPVPIVHNQIQKFIPHSFYRRICCEKTVNFIHVVKQCTQFQDLLLYALSGIALRFDKLERQNSLKSRLLKGFQDQWLRQIWNSWECCCFTSGYHCCTISNQWNQKHIMCADSNLPPSV